MSIPRIPPIEPPYEKEVAEELERWMGPGNRYEPLKLFRTFMVNAELSGRMFALGSGILGPKALVDPRHREVMIHRTTALNGAEYEWGVHATIFGEKLGFTEEQLFSTVHGGPFDPCWDERESLVFALADDLHHDSDVSDYLYRALDVHWTPQQIIELLATAGWYRTISYLAKGPRVELEPWARRFPRRPDGGDGVSR